MAGRIQRTATLVIALVFLATSIAGTGLIIYQIVNEGKEQSSSSDTTNQTATQTPQEGALEGTKLANFTPIDKVEKLEIIDTAEGTGAVVKAGDTVTAHYTGALAKDGTIFQSSKDMGQPVPFSLNQVIEGWSKGVPGMKVGGTRRLIVPAAQAYGPESPSPNIPPNSDLVFDIELVKIGE